MAERNRAKEVLFVKIDLRPVADALSRQIGLTLDVSRLEKALEVCVYEGQSLQQAFDRLALAVETARTELNVEDAERLSGGGETPSEGVKSASIGRKIRIRGGKNGRSEEDKA